MEYTEGIKTGIVAANTVLAEIGPAVGSEVPNPELWLSASVDAVMEVQHRNAANTANIWGHRFWISALSPIVISKPPPCVLQSDERLRVVLSTALLMGSVQASMLT